MKTVLLFLSFQLMAAGAQAEEVRNTSGVLRHYAEGAYAPVKKAGLKGHCVISLPEYSPISKTEYVEEVSPEWMIQNAMSVVVSPEKFKMTFYTRVGDQFDNVTYQREAFGGPSLVETQIQFAADGVTVNEIVMNYGSDKSVTVGTAFKYTKETRFVAEKNCPLIRRPR